jgi:hypothetical protein
MAIPERIAATDTNVAGSVVVTPQGKPAIIVRSRTPIPTTGQPKGAQRCLSAVNRRHAVAHWLLDGCHA